MKILVVAGSYPHAGHPFSGVFNEKCVLALRDLCDLVEVLVLRPYVPRFLRKVQRWNAYAAAPAYEVRDGVKVSRPAVPVLPLIGTALWPDSVAFIWCRQAARSMHHRNPFDAILSFDLSEAGGVSWRIGRDLGIPASGWAFGMDARFPRSSPLGKVVTRAIERLDLVFYQSQELFQKAANLLGVPPNRMSGSRHVILPHGIPEPPSLLNVEIRNRIRSEWRITNNEVVVLNIGRITRDKGMIELLEAISFASARDSRIIGVIIGSKPAFDESVLVQKTIDQIPRLKERVRLLPACSPDKVWEYLCAADIFAFPSHKEGMPNSLLEAMVMEIPAVAFAIPPVLEIEAGTGGVELVPPLNSMLFSKAILRLSVSPEIRVRVGKIGREQVIDRFMVRKNMTVAIQQLTKVLNRTSSESQRIGV